MIIIIKYTVYAFKFYKNEDYIQPIQVTYKSQNYSIYSKISIKVNLYLLYK